MYEESSAISQLIHTVRCYACSDTGTMDDNKEFLEKDVLSTLPLAPGGVYSVKWEARRKLSKQIDVDPIAYETPYPINLSNPFCFLVSA